MSKSLKTLRRQQGLTQAELAEMLNISSNGYAKIERGETQLTINKLTALSKIFKITEYELLQKLYPPPAHLTKIRTPLLDKTIDELAAIIANQAQEIAKLKLELAKYQSNQ